MSPIQVPDIKARDTFWHDGLHYTAIADAKPATGVWYRVGVRRSADSVIKMLDLQGQGIVLRADRPEGMNR